MGIWQQQHKLRTASQAAVAMVWRLFDVSASGRVDLAFPLQTDDECRKTGVFVIMTTTSLPALQELWKTRSRPTPLHADELLDAETSAPPGTANGSAGHAKGLNASRALGLTEVHKLWSLQVLPHRAAACVRALGQNFISVSHACCGVGVRVRPCEVWTDGPRGCYAQSIV